jgi:hypothetical protein
VLLRAKFCSEWDGCGLKNGEYGLRDTLGRWWGWEAFSSGMVDADAEFHEDRKFPKEAYRITLTIAHLNHNPQNNGGPGNRPNLAAWCQYHHLKYDRGHHIANSRRTRDLKKGQVPLPLEAID